MPTLQLEHAIHDFDRWKQAFDFDPIKRQESGVQRYRIYRPVEDPKYVIVELDFEAMPEAEKFKDALHELWKSPMAAPALAGTPTARIVETAEVKEY